MGKPLDTETDELIPLAEKCLLLFGGLIAPVCTHLLIIQFAGNGQWIYAPRYQTGLLKDKLSFLLSFDALLWLYPLILFSLVAFTALVVDLCQTGKEAWARFGLLTGIPLGLAFHLALLAQTKMDAKQVFLFHVIPIVFVLSAWGFAALLMRFTPDRKAATIAGVTLLLGLLTLICTVRVIATGDNTHWAMLAFPLIAVAYALVFYGPLIWLGCFGWMAGRLATAHPSVRQITLAGLLSWVTWLATFFAACRHAVISSLESYSRLPTSDPGTCYVATAGCRGHGWFVGRSQRPDHGLVNPQLQTFKAFELALTALCPRFHRHLRRYYDRFGPAVANRIRCRLAGDIAFATLAPLQWIVWLLLFALLGRNTILIRHLYLDSAPSPGEPGLASEKATVHEPMVH